MPPDRRWELAYETGDFRHWESDYPSAELAAIVVAGILPKKAKVLDVGSGGGKDAIFLAQCGFEVIGVDISHAAIEIARKRAAEARAHVDWRRASVFELPIDDSSIDLVTDRGLFHHVKESDRPKYASELFRVLKPRGRALIRGASEKSAEGRFIPVTEEAISKHFPPSRFTRGPVLLLPLISVVGILEGRIVMLRKVSVQ